jgi:hypothetical protein
MFHDFTLAAKLRFATSVIFLLLATASMACARTPPARGQVLIYYACETRPTTRERENYETIIDWLESSDRDRAHAIAVALRNEMTLFPAAVDEEIVAIGEFLPHQRANLSAVIFTNGDTRAGKYRYLLSGEREFRAGKISPPRTADYILASNPLAMPEMLRVVLTETARRFPPDTHEYVLVTKGHGGAEMALTVRLARQHETTSREQLLAALDNPQGVPPSPAIGIRKAEYFSILAEFGKQHEMTFPLVFMEACQGQIEPQLQQQLPTNVALLYTSGGRYLKYQTLPYEELLREVDEERLLSVVLDEFMAPRYLALYRQPSTLSSWWLLLLFVPLLVGLALYAAKRSRRPQHSRAVSTAETNRDLTTMMMAAN